MNDLFGKSQGTTQTQGSNSPWSGVQPYLTDVFAQGKANFSQGASPFTTQAAQMQAQRAQDPNALVGQAQRQLGSTIQGQYLNPDSNPWLKNSVQDALGLAGSAFEKQYGGNAGGNLSNSGYQEMLARSLGNVATNAYSNAYGNERQNQMAAIGMAPGLDYANTGALAGAGALQDSALWSPLAQYQASISGGLGPFGQQTGQQPYYQNNTLGTLGAITSGLGAYKLFGSDRRLKSNIVKVADDPRGFGIYDYDLAGERLRGVMADEVEKVMPEAVADVNGFKAVYYGRLFP